MQNVIQIRRALFSVSDKAYLEDLAKGFHSLGIEIIATSGTAASLKRVGIPYIPIEDFTGNPQAFDGRMKTLSFKLESAILFDRTNPTHVQEAENLKIPPVDCVVCNFYPFEEALAKDESQDALVAQIDIGGPTMVRASAKNFKNVLTLVDPSDYARVLAELRKNTGFVSFETSRQMMVKAFEKVMHYDQAIFEGFARKKLRYGENPHQIGYFVPSSEPRGIDWVSENAATIELSYNNILDAQAAFGAMMDTRVVSESSHGVCVIVKHNNPCGLATAPTIEGAFERAWAGDPVSAFGGVVALSSPLTLECARLLEDKFVEVLLTPGYEESAFEALKRKKKKLRVLVTSPMKAELTVAGEVNWQRAQVQGGYLLQAYDEGVGETFKCVTQTKFPDKLLGAARFAVVCAKWIKSNSIAIAQSFSDGSFQLVGMGSGQPNRVDALEKLAIPKAVKNIGEEALTGCILASDAFFPFSDSVEAAHKAGLRFLVQPGGSIRDQEVIDSCNKLGMAMLFTGKRHFRH